jgi:hypothetical protein
MRKATIGLLVVLCLMIGGSAQNRMPQWRVVDELSSIDQTTGTGSVIIFTPQKRGVYRLSTAISAIGPAGAGSWNLFFQWNDLNGYPAAASVSGVQNVWGANSEIGALVFSPKPGTQVRYIIEPSGDTVNSSYSFAFTIEQLQ